MAPAKLFLFALATVPALFAQLAAAAGGKKDGLASESLEDTQFVGNLTEEKGGWVDPGVCAGDYCIYSNRYIAGGRGVSIVTNSKNKAQMSRTEGWLKQAESNWMPREPPFELKELEDGTKAFVANTTIKRGTPLMGFTPILIVHKEFFEDVKKAADQDRVLSAAVKLLPWATRQKFAAQKVAKSTGHKVKDAIMSLPFETDLGYATMATEESTEKHFLLYPETAGLRHDCRPNTAYYIDGFLAHRTVAARKIEPGERLTISLTDFFSGRAARRAQHKRLYGHECECQQCRAGGDLQELKKSDDRLKQIMDIETELKDHTSTHVTAEMIERLIKLYKDDRLQAKLSGAYQLAALNYNYIGKHKDAVRYANLANQAAIIEQGPESVDALTMRILANDPQGHYSWNQKDKYKGPNVGKRS
ncbi:hypothetical protein GQ53DRAFT_743620 [Thozetella sp. PMI_491]|nr:hypothetical protein GQ53DRAFT_743620 [Thozetella sp. PMI_491]